MTEEEKLRTAQWLRRSAHDAVLARRMEAGAEAQPEITPEDIDLGLLLCDIPDPVRTALEHRIRAVVLHTLDSNSILRALDAVDRVRETMRRARDAERTPQPEPAWASILAEEGYIERASDGRRYVWRASNQYILFDIWQCLSDVDREPGTFPTFCEGFVRPDGSPISDSPHQLAKRARDPDRERRRLPDRVKERLRRA